MSSERAKELESLKVVGSRSLIFKEGLISFLR
jgi:hypothetical protein